MSYLSLSRQEKKMMLLGPFLNRIAVKLSKVNISVVDPYILLKVWIQP